MAEPKNTQKKPSKSGESNKSNQPKGGAEPKGVPATFSAGADPLAVAPAAIASVAASHIGLVVTPPPYDQEQAQAALEAVRPRLAAIAADRLVTPRVDVDASCRVLLSVYAFLTQAPLMSGWLQALHGAKLFDLENLDRLHDLSLVVMYAHRQAAAAGAFASEAKILPQLDKDSAALEAVMQRVCEHNLDDHPVHGPVLRLLSPGTGYLDRADDLLGYANMYEAELSTISKDTKYDSTHVASARKMAGDILAALGLALTPQAREWVGWLYRAWTLLTRTYAEVQAATLFLLRLDPLASERVPSLFVVGRPGVGRSKKKVAEGESGAPKEPSAPAKPV